jgi:sugar phosphate isomerase/epimerase
LQSRLIAQNSFREIHFAPAKDLLLNMRMKSHFSFFIPGILFTTLIFFAGCANTPAGPTVGTGPSFKGPIGLQLYSLRAQFAKDVPGTLDVVKSFGIKYVELAGTYNLSPAEFKSQLDSHGLVPISGHFGFDLYRDHLDEVVRDAEALGLKYAGCAWIPHKGDFDEKTCREAAAVFNHAGEVLAQHGIKFFYHTHGYEFQPHGDGTLFDLLMAETNPKYVHYQMDIFWIVFPGQDPAKILAKYGHRFELMHLKDMRKGLATGSLSGGTDVRNDVALGTGQIDMVSVLRAAKKAGIKWYFIEDESPDSEQQIPVSLRYLEQVKW